ALIAVPDGVVSRKRPEPVAVGMVAVRLDVVAAVMERFGRVLSVSWLLAAVGSKFDPLITTDEPATPIVGEKPEIVGGARTCYVTLTVAVPLAAPLIAVTVAVPAVAPVTTTVAPLGANVTMPAGVTDHVTGAPGIGWPF